MTILISIGSEKGKLESRMKHDKTSIQELSLVLGRVEIIKIKILSLLGKATEEANKNKG